MYEDQTASVGFEEIFQRASEEKRYLQSVSGKLRIYTIWSYFYGYVIIV